jgi:hypothetical protein
VDKKAIHAQVICRCSTGPTPFPDRVQVSCGLRAIRLVATYPQKRASLVFISITKKL